LGQGDAVVANTPLPPPDGDAVRRSRRSATRRGLIAIAIAAVVILAGTTLLGRLFGGAMAWAPWSPRAPELPVPANDERTATSLVTGWVDAHPSMPGAKHLGTQVEYWCEGASPGRATCELNGYQFDAWSGDFERVAAPARAAMVSACGDPAAPAVRATPEDYRETDMESFGCPGGLQVDLVFYTAGSASGYISNKDCSWNHYTCLPGTSTDEILKHLSGYSWLAVRNSHTRFHRP
jgi:hypothetical protein